MSYEKEYRIVDEILEGSARPTSPFTAKDGASLLDTLFDRSTHIPIWILSLGNAVVSIEELEAKMVKHGRRTRSIALKYQHLPAVATEEKKRENLEFLVVGWDEAALSVFGIGFRNHQLGGDIDRAIPGVHDNFHPRGSKRSAAQSLLVDALKKDDAPLPEQVASEGRGLSVLELQSGVDHPDTVLGESGLDHDSEPRVDTTVGHGPTVHGTSLGVKSEGT
jgi:hypothetical protein